MSIASELSRVAQSVAMATLVSFIASSRFNQPFWVALPLGFLVGVGSAIVTIARDRRRER